MRTLSVDLEEILSLISTAETYGWYDSMLMDAFAGMLGNQLSDEEIHSYAKSISDLEGYTVEDYNEIKEELEYFKSRFINQKD